MKKIMFILMMVVGIIFGGVSNSYANAPLYRFVGPDSIEYSVDLRHIEKSTDGTIVSTGLIRTFPSEMNNGGYKYNRLISMIIFNKKTSIAYFGGKYNAYNTNIPSDNQLVYSLGTPRDNVIVTSIPKEVLQRILSVIDK